MFWLRGNRKESVRQNSSKFLTNFPHKKKASHKERLNKNNKGNGD